MRALICMVLLQPRELCQIDPTPHSAQQGRGAFLKKHLNGLAHALAGVLWPGVVKRPHATLIRVWGSNLIVHSGLPGLAGWRSVPVEHCSDAHGLVLRAAAGWSLVFSGDTRPCAALATAGRGATLLVHEATFEPALLAQVWEGCPVNARTCNNNAVLVCGRSSCLRCR